MKRSLLSLIEVVGFCAIVLGVTYACIYGFPDNSPKEEYNYTLSAEDIVMWHDLPHPAYYRTTQVTITLDRVPSAPLEVRLYIEREDLAHVVTLEGLSQTVYIDRSSEGDPWEMGRVWSDPAWHAESDHARLIRTQTVNV